MKEFWLIKQIIEIEGKKLTYKQVENLIKEASRKLNKNNFKSYSTSLFSNHIVKGTGLTTITNLQSASVLS